MLRRQHPHPAGTSGAFRTFVAAVVLLGATPAAASTIEDGHADYVARIVDGRLVAQIKTSDGRWRDPAGAVVRLDQRARTTLPASVPGLGPRGRRVWTSPQRQRSGVVWLGWSTESLRARKVTGALRWTLTSVRGPGRFALFQTDALGHRDVLFASSRRRPGTRTLAAGTHAHGTWAFTRAGRYRLTFRWKTRSPAGRPLSHTSVVRFHIG